MSLDIAHGQKACTTLLFLETVRAVVRSSCIHSLFEIYNLITSRDYGEMKKKRTLPLKVLTF